jgi:hypothetical protein
MSFPLEYIEINVPEPFLIQAEDLIEQNAISMPQEVEKNLWMASTTSGYEVEVQVSGAKVIAYSCECATFLRDGLCEHIVAALLLVRKQTQIQKALKQEQKKAEPIDKKLTIKQLLDQVDSNELKQFIQSYAAKDRNFGIALKVRFAGNVEFLDDKKKYLQLLDDAIRASRKKDQHLSYRGTQKLLKVANELLHQLETAFLQQHYTTAIFIAQSLIEKFTPILRKTNQHNELLLIVEAAFTHLSNIADAAISPALTKDLWNYALLESSKITYRINEIVPYFYKLLTLLAEKLGQEEALLSFFNDFSIQSAYSEKNYTRLLIAKMTLLEKMNLTTEAQAIVKQNINNPELLLHALHQAKQKGDIKQMKYLADLGLEANFLSFIHQHFVTIRLDIAQQENDLTLAASLARNLLIQTFDLAHFQIFKSITTQHNTQPIVHWQNTFQQLLKDLETAPFSIAKRDFIAKIHAAEENWEDLFAYIIKLKSLDILEQFDQYLVKVFKNEVFELYQNLLEDYIKHHVGRVPSKKIRQKIEHLFDIGAKQVAIALIKKFRYEYADRQSLMKELENFVI